MVFFQAILKNWCWFAVAQLTHMRGGTLLGMPERDEIWDLLID